MAPTILVVGATGNTGRGVVELLPKLIQSSPALKNHRILALTRSKDSTAAKHIATFPNVEVAEQNWTEITADWLIKENVVRAFVASHNEPTQFADEGTFYRNALDAGVKYVVRISTTAANVKPDCRAYYPRTHWAIEAMLDTPEYADLHWSSLQPNGFYSLVSYGVAEHIKTYRRTGKHEPFSTFIGESAPAGLVEPLEVGAFAAHLLATEDTTKHNKQRYVLNGPEDTTGQGLLQLIEEHVGSRPQDVNFNDMRFIENMAAAAKGSKNVIRTIERALDVTLQGLASASTTSKEVLEIAPPKRTLREVLDEMLRE